MRRCAPYLVGVAALAFLGCSDRTSTEPGIVPAELLSLSPAADTVEMGETIDPPVAVQVIAASGEPVEGIPVRFLLEAGPGEVFPNLAVSDEEGVAEAFFQAGGLAGESRVRADIPSASNVEPLSFDVVTVPSAFVQLAVEEGNGQTAEVESQLPLPFAVTALAGEGIPAGGIAIAWEVRSQLAGLRLSADTSFTDEEGRAEVLLTLGHETGEIVVAAYAARTTVSDTIQFTATARTVLETGVIIDFVEPLPLQAGQQATMFGGGFSALADENEVRIEGVEAEILSASPTEIIFIVPAFLDRCLPERQVGLRALVREEASNGQFVDLLPAQPAVTLRTGEAALLQGDQATCVQLAGAADYVFHVQSADRAPDGVAAVRMGLRTAEDAEINSSQELDVAAAAADQAGGDVGEGLVLSSALAELLSRDVQPIRMGGSGPAARAAFRSADVADGDTLDILFAVQPNLAISCEDTARVISGIVRAVGEHVILVEDPLAPPAGFAGADWTLLKDEFDATVYPTATAFFGEAADIDGNGRVIVLYTPEVNRLSQPGGDRINGFFLLTDLARSDRPGGGGVPGKDGSVCATSNEGEILYVAVSDPDGAFGSPFTSGQALRAGRRTAAHELQHLLNAQQRVVLGTGDFADIEESWLDEGLSHLAEELVGLQLMGLAETPNITFGLIENDRDRLDVFNIYHLPNFFSLALYMSAPGIAPVLSPVDPGGLGSEQMRGFAHFFVRWLLDQLGGEDPAAFVRAIASGGGGQRSGIANVENVAKRSWDELIADFAMTLAVDDTGVTGLPDRFTIGTWDLRDIFAGLNANPSAGRRFRIPYPLAVTPLGFSAASLDFDLNASTEAFFSIGGSGEATPVAIELLGQDGAFLPPTANPQLLIVRTR
ncbi:MAG: hypothetical protein KAJ67_08000 [Gemmatimonadetes bacterium]|nr:hypothetical protein [Gemmatimonadota bacterium]